LLLFRLTIYTSGVAAERVCTVSFTDVRGVKHTVEVTAESLFEAAVLGVKRLRAGEWNDPPGQSTVLEIEVRHPGVRHAVTLQQVARWLNGASSSPAESMKKVHLRDLLAAK
jgi:hypothetical protein